jgi:ELWxxDGT repeat protein
MAGGKAFFRATTLEHGAELWVASGQGPGRMIADINPGSGSSMPDHLMEMDGILYFSADDGVHGNELWRSDGTEQGTYRLIDIRPGLSGSDPKPLAAAPGKLWFSARTLNSYELWCTDGRADNTLKLPAGLSERSFFSPAGHTFLGDTLYFGVGPNLWKSDGTVEGTSPIQTINQGPAPSIEEMVVSGDSIYFVVESYLTNGRRKWLWRTNGEVGGAVIIPRETGFESWSELREIRALQGRISFLGQTEQGAELVWRCGDGTLDGSVRFPDFKPNTLGLGEAVLLGDILYFSRFTEAEGAEIWRSDGTLEGTFLVMDIYPGSGSSQPRWLCSAGNSVYFVAQDRTRGREIWKTDGTPKGTKLAVETTPGRYSMETRNLVSNGNEVYFIAGDLTFIGDQDLWRTDGTKKGTLRLTAPEKKPIGGLEPSLSYRQPIAALGERVFFNAKSPKFGHELWTSDGTAKGTKQLIDAQRGPESSSPMFLTPVADRLIYATSTGFSPSQVWTSNGTRKGTIPLTAAGPYQHEFNTDGSRLFFTSSSIDSSLWVTNGTTSGTRELPIPGNTPLNVVEGTLQMVGSTAFFANSRRAERYELWRSDGTPQGTTIVHAFPVLPFNDPERPKLFTAVGDSICFFFERSAFLRLWLSDGTTEGTVEVPINFNPGNHFRLVSAVPFDSGRFLFLADAQNGGMKWWVSDGTTGGTRILKDLALSPVPDYLRGRVHEHVRIGGILYMVIGTAEHGRELWRTDGTTQGTYMVADIMPGQDGSNPEHLQVFGGRIYFAASDPVRGRELWCRDGTPAGTTLLSEVMPGDRSSNPDMLCIAGSKLFFAAENPVAGYELHVLDLPLLNGSASSIASKSAIHGSGAETGQGALVLESDEDLLRRAFNVGPRETGRTGLETGDGISGYPTFTSIAGVFRVEFLRRRDGSFHYVPKWSASLEPGSFVRMSGLERSVEVNAEWERVTVDQPILPGTPRMFGVVEVTRN